MLSWLLSGSVWGHCVEGLWSGFSGLVVQYRQDLVVLAIVLGLFLEVPREVVCCFSWSIRPLNFNI